MTDDTRSDSRTVNFEGWRIQRWSPDSQQGLIHSRLGTLSFGPDQARWPTFVEGEPVEVRLVAGDPWRVVSVTPIYFRDLVTLPAVTALPPVLETFQRRLNEVLCSLLNHLTFACSDTRGALQLEVTREGGRVLLRQTLYEVSYIQMPTRSNSWDRVQVFERRAWDAVNPDFVALWGEWDAPYVFRFEPSCFGQHPGYILAEWVDEGPKVD